LKSYLSELKIKSPNFSARENCRHGKKGQAKQLRSLLTVRGFALLPLICNKPIKLAGSQIYAG
jgi:hypothetical protein